MVMSQGPYWPPVKGPATAGTGVTGKLATIKRSDGSAQAAYNGHPRYTYVSDTAPGQAKDNGVNLSGGVWHEVTVSGTAAPARSGHITRGPRSPLRPDHRREQVPARDSRPARCA